MINPLELQPETKQGKRLKLHLIHQALLQHDIDLEYQHALEREKENLSREVGARKEPQRPQPRVFERMGWVHN